LQRLIRMGVFFQGHRWRCQTCGHTNWLSVDLLKQSNKCEVCTSEKQIEVSNLKWDFMLNPKVAEALYKDDVIAELWILGSLLREARESFYFAPQSSFFQNPQDKEPAYEVDIVCIQDGRLLIGEAKRKASQFTDSVIQELIVKAQDLRPDAVVVGFLEEDADISSKITTLKNRELAVVLTAPLPNPVKYDPWSYF